MRKQSQSAGHCCRASLRGTAAQTHLRVLTMEKCAFRLRQGTAVLLPVSIIFPRDHQRLFLGHLFLLEDFPHEVPFVHRGSDDFQVVGVDDYLPKVYNRRRLEKQRASVSHHQAHACRTRLMPHPYPQPRNKRRALYLSAL